ncbi:MAG: hypothetical protein H0W69_02920 [Gemmatimonadaceae bacterium]|nr:hypothetical protein [Gemmatimonadaceae bacterium]
MQQGGAGALSYPRSVQLHRTDLYDVVMTVLLMIFLFFFFVGEKIESLPLPVRIEDFVFILLLPFGYRYINRPKTKLFYWVAAYFAVNLIPYGAQFLAGEYSLSFYPIIMVKEMQYFYVAYLLVENRSRWTLGTLDFLSLLIIGNGVRAIYQGEISYYGIGSFGNATAPSLVGALYLFSTIWLHVRTKLLNRKEHRWMGRIIVAAGFTCVLATISRSSIAAMAVYIFVYLVMTNVKLLPAFFAGLGVSTKAVQIAALFGSGVGVLAAKVVGRAALVGSAALERSNKWEFYLSTFQPMDYLFGMGKGYPNALESRLGLGVDSQYIRLIMENGFVGGVVLIGILGTMLTHIYRRGGEWVHASAIVLAMMVMSVPLEALQVSKSGGFFWLLMFYLYSCQRKTPAAVRATA